MILRVKLIITNTHIFNKWRQRPGRLKVKDSQNSDYWFSNNNPLLAIKNQRKI